jgi:hypothetical protein
MPKKQVAVSLRKPPPAVDPDAFVKAEETTQAVAKPRAQALDPIVTHGSREYREMTLYIPASIARDLSFFCMDQNRDVNGVVSEAVSKFVLPESSVPQPVMPQAPPALHVQIAELSKQSLRALWARRPWAI